MEEPMRVFSNGGGVQSSAALVLSARGEIDYPVHLWSNVGDDSEHPDSLDYIRNHLMPYAEAHGIVFHELHKKRRDKQERTLYQTIMNPGSKSIQIPMRLSNGSPGNRSCTVKFKIDVIDSWLYHNGVKKENPAIVGIGISVDEIQRAGRGKENNFSRRAYPLLDLGLRRIDCLNIVADAGLPEPPKSSCYFCPFHRQQTWSEMRRDRPDLFEKAAEIEDTINERRVALNKDKVYLSSRLIPLREAAGVAQQGFWDTGYDDGDGESCDSGHCFT
jgi:hypothetical protein